ncbi:TadE/TadG family type IV pilus assembly protein [Bradyrhizobium sp. URHD0069]|uniref:TadE/TadG family type IV pilus assembly protein n=1 Tax=Bradyrhizobium sp. URHD0069 TaxID=1380355 RepID=UPI000496D06D|nr:TadE/TadG family type IV pilus assembly protein [Bradyrhizobium sp. URHD0069]
MKPLAPSGLLAPLQPSAVRLMRDKGGNAAVEFAVIVPLMLVMFFGMVEFTSAISIARKMSLVTQGLADLASRYASVGDTDIDNFNIIAKTMLTPYSATPLKSTITELYIDPSTGVARAQWSKGAEPRGLGSSVHVPENLIARDSVTTAILPNQYLIFSEANYLYTPAVGYVMDKAGFTLSEKSYMRPRLTTCVIYPTPAPGAQPNCPKS